MTRHFFRFTMVDGSLVELMTTDQGDADKITKHRWTTGAATYLSPWMSPLVPDGYGDLIPDGEKLACVNLVHVTAIKYERRGE